MTSKDLQNHQTDGHSQPVSARIATVYSSLNEAERRVADYINSDLRSARGLSITQMGEQSGVSHATIVRFCRRLGFRGYTDFKLALAEDLSWSQMHKSLTSLLGEDVDESGGALGALLASNSPKIIGCIGPVFDTEIMTRIYAGIERACRKQGFHVITADSFSDHETEKDRVRSLVEAGCQAIILYPVTRTCEQLEQDYLRTEYRSTPIVLVDIAYDEQMRSQVVFDNYRAGWDMTTALIDRGHTKIAFMLVAGDIDGYMIRSTRERYQGYRDAMKSAGLNPRDDDLWVMDGRFYFRPNCTRDFTHEEMAEALAQLVRDKLSQPEPPTALIAREDTSAAMIINLTRLFGTATHEEFQVVGFDNLRASALCYPPFPTTAPDFTRAGEIAVEIALNEINTESAKRGIRSYILPVPLELRGMGRNTKVSCEPDTLVELQGGGLP